MKFLLATFLFPVLLSAQSLTPTVIAGAGAFAGEGDAVLRDIVVDLEDAGPGAIVALRLGLNPYEHGSKSASKIGSSTSLAAMPRRLR